VLIDGAQTAVIDFDDSGFGWHQYDLTVALIAYQDHPDFVMFRDACIAGYRSVRAISDAGPRAAANVPADPRHGASAGSTGVRNCLGRRCCRDSSIASAPRRRTSSC